MSNINDINSQLGSIAEAVRSEIVYDLSMKVNVRKFFELRFQKQLLDQTKLNYNLYKNYIHG